MKTTNDAPNLSNTGSVSEFHRLRPTKTMAAINELIKDLEGLENDDTVTVPSVLKRVKHIKELFKQGA